MRPAYGTDHPVELKRANTMSFAELRYWIRELRTNPVYGICTIRGGKSALDREMGAAPSALSAKLVGGWIFPSEQGRFTRVIMLIREGRLVLKSDPIYANRAYFVVQDPPKPPIPPQKTPRMAFKLGVGIVRIPEPDYQQAVPSLRGLFDRAKVRS
jgi:hypothetical protein